jgi:hypothetical protein
VPLTQYLQVVIDWAEEYVPVLQGAQFVPGPKYPTLQLHVLEDVMPDPVSYDPTEQGTHEKSAVNPIPVPYQPAGQNVQFGVPMEGWYVPARQESQKVLPKTLWYIPMLQLKHAVAFWDVIKVPA